MHLLLLFSKQKWKIYHTLAVSPKLRDSYAAVAVRKQRAEGLGLKIPPLQNHIHQSF